MVTSYFSRILGFGNSIFNVNSFLLNILISLREEEAGRFAIRALVCLHFEVLRFPTLHLGWLRSLTVALPGDLFIVSIHELGWAKLLCQFHFRISVGEVVSPGALF